MTISMTREALLEKLNERLAAAKAEDEKNRKLHVAEEKKALQEFRIRLREAIKWDYAAWKGYVDAHYQGLRPKFPSCPMLHANGIQRAIKAAGWDTRKSAFRISETSDYWRALNWLPPSEVPKTTVCD